MRFACFDFCVCGIIDSFLYTKRVLLQETQAQPLLP